MVIPFKHTANIAELSQDEFNSLMQMGRIAVDALKVTYKPEGFNLGMNLGVSGGAGIKDHLHLHVVPRWLGDTNFMPILAETKSMPQHLEASYDELYPVFVGIQQI